MDEQNYIPENYEQQPQYQAPQYQAPQYQQPQYQQPQYQAPQYQQPQYQVPQYQQPQYQQYQPAPAVKAEGGSKGGLVMSIIGFAISMLAALLALVGIINFADGGYYGLESAFSCFLWSLILSIPGLIFGIIGLAKKGKKGFALTAVIVSAVLLLLAFIFVVAIADAIY